MAKQRAACFPVKIIELALSLLKLSSFEAKRFCCEQYVSQTHYKFRQNTSVCAV